MKALQSERGKILLKECEGGHGRGVARVIAQSQNPHINKLQYYCQECKQTFHFEVTALIKIN